jgi:hypothetical protein
MKATFSNEISGEMIMEGVASLPNGERICVIDKGVHEQDSDAFVSDPGYPEFRHNESDEPLLDDVLEAQYKNGFSYKDYILSYVEWL